MPTQQATHKATLKSLYTDPQTGSNLTFEFNHAVATLSSQAARPSSMTLTPGTAAALYKEPSFKGDCRLFANVEFVDLVTAGFGVIGSLTVGSATELKSCEFLALYEQPNFLGAQLLLEARPGGHDLSATDWARRAASIKVIGTRRAWRVMTGHEPNLCSSFSDDVADLDVFAVGSRRVTRVANGACLDSGVAVKLHDAWDYQGRSVKVEQSIADVSVLGLSGAVSSISILSQSAALYSAVNFKGVCTTAWSNIARLDDSAVGNDKVASVSLNAVCPEAYAAIRLHDDWDYQGRSITIEQATPDLSVLGLTGVASSVSLLKGKPAALFSGVNYTGDCTTASANIARLNDHAVGNDRVASVRLDITCPVSRAIRLHDAWDYQGRSVVIEQDVPDLAAVGFSGILSSVTLLTDKPAALYSGVNYTGQCSTAATNTARLNDRAVGNDRAASVRLGASCPLPAEAADWLMYFSHSNMGPFAWVDGPALVSKDPSLPYAVFSGVADGVRLYVCRPRVASYLRVGKYLMAAATSCRKGAKSPSRPDMRFSPTRCRSSNTRSCGRGSRRPKCHHMIASST